MARVPIVETQHHYRHVRQIDHRADAEGEQYLARSQLPDPRPLRSHTAHSTPSASASSVSSTFIDCGTRLGSSSMALSCKMRPTVGSTLRSDLRHEKASHCLPDGSFMRPIVNPSFRDS